VNTRILIGILLTIIAIESALLALPHLALLNPFRVSSKTFSQSFSFGFYVFNQPISNDTEQRLNPGLPGSWEIDIQSSLSAASGGIRAEAEMAFAPAYSNENHSIPTLIVQERSDGLLRIEYYAQNWPNSYGLLLFNSTLPGWQGRSVSIDFKSTGPPSQVNPELAPRPNGDVTITLGGTTVLSDYPIAWADLSELYLYGYPGSSFNSGEALLSFYQI